MDILLVHLSDIHLREKDNPINDRIPHILCAVENYAARSDFVFLVFSGDITWCGQEKETMAAMMFIEELRKSLLRNPRIGLEIIMVPGNHDCDFGLQTAVRDNLVGGIIEKGLESAIDEQVVEQCTAIQKKFFQLCDCFENEANVVEKNQLAKLHSFLVEDRRVVFNCLNSAWLSLKDERPGRVVIPDIYLPADPTPFDVDVLITLTHHPLNWFNPDQMRDVRTRLEKVSDIIITGHEHFSDRFQRNDLSQMTTMYIEGGMLQDPTDPAHSSFNVIRLRLEPDRPAEFSFMECNWDGSRFVENEEKKATGKLAAKRSQGPHGLQLSQDFSQKLDDPGANFTHPRVRTLSLPDIFVYPDVRTFSINPRRAQPRISETLSSATLLRFGPGCHNRVLLLGPQKSGRTSLLKTLFRWIYENGFLAVWIDGYDLTTTTKDHVVSRVNHAVANQYSARDQTLLDQHPDRQKVILIDDLDRSRVARKHRDRLIDSLLSVYDHVIITASDLIEVEELSVSDQSDGKTIFDQFDIYQILEFGHVLRDRLVRRWISLGQDVSIETNDFYRKVDEAKSIIDSVIGKNLVPSHPFFLLALLQTYEAASLHDLRHSSYGYYYEYLILGALQQINVRPEQVDACQNYLAELAYHLFKSRQEALTISSLSEFETSYAAEYGLPSLPSSLRQDLARINILSVKDDEVCFRYKYLYYFFVAKYLATHLDEAQIRDLVKDMASHPHVSLYANILMLLTYLSRDSFIVDSILDTAGKVFSDKPPCRLEQDTDFLNQLIDDVPQLVLQSIKTEEARAKALQARDQAESSGYAEAPEITDDKIAEIYELDLLARVNLAFKLSEILGQVSKNYYGSLKQLRKVQIVREAYSTVLRTLTVFFQILDSHREQLVSDLVGILKEHNLADVAERERIVGFSKSFIFQISAAVSYGFFRKVSRFVGSKNLAQVFEDILKEGPSVAVQLIDRAIKLDHFTGFPYGEIKALHKRIEKNKLALTILRALVVNHLYMFDVGFRDRQRICDEFKITMAETRRIDLTSREKK